MMKYLIIVSLMFVSVTSMASLSTMPQGDSANYFSGLTDEVVIKNNQYPLFCLSQNDENTIAEIRKTFSDKTCFIDPFYGINVVLNGKAFDNKAPDAQSNVKD